jgi:hypothetical protein
MFRHTVPIEVGEIVTRDRFTFADLLPRNAGGAEAVAAQGFDKLTQ